MFRIKQIFFTDGFELLQVVLPTHANTFFVHTRYQLFSQLVGASQLVEKVGIDEKTLFV